MTLSDEILMAYADGELDPQTRTQVEDAIASDPEVARRVAAHEALRSQLRSSFDRVLAEPVPDGLVAAARAKSGTASSNRVVALLPRRAGTRFWPGWGAIAASFVVGALVWHFALERDSAGLFSGHHGEFVASGALDNALSNQLANGQSAGSAVELGVSFRSKGGNYCRTFQLPERLAGLACRQHSAWRIEVLARNQGSQESHPGYRPAGSALPAPVLQAVEQSIDGEPLDAEAEAHAKAAQWLARH